MSKFKKGDKARIIGNTNYHGFTIGSVVEVASDVYHGSERDKRYSCKSGGYCWAVRPTDMEPVPKFEWGEEVEVSDDGKSWDIGVFVGLNPNNERYKYITMRVKYTRIAAAWRYCRKIEEKPQVELTLDEIACKFGLDVEQLRIKD